MFDVSPSTGPILNEREFARFSWLTGHLPHRWIASRRSRRILFLALATPGFLAVFSTTYHHNFFLMVIGFGLFGAAVLFRSRSEPLFVRAEAASLWPSPDIAAPAHKDPTDA